MPAKASIGFKRIPTKSRGSVADFTRQARASMRAINANLGAVTAGIKNATPGAMKYGLHPILEQAKYFCPVDTGELKNSAYLEAEDRGDGIVTAEIGFGAKGRPFYAVFVHERTDLAHEAPTRAKFLQEAVSLHVHKVRARIYRFLRGEVRKDFRWGD